LCPLQQHQLRHDCDSLQVDRERPKHLKHNMCMSEWCNKCQLLGHNTINGTIRYLLVTPAGRISCSVRLLPLPLLPTHAAASARPEASCAMLLLCVMYHH
jgi:hypothetical protein